MKFNNEMIKMGENSVRPIKLDDLEKFICNVNEVFSLEDAMKVIYLVVRDRMKKKTIKNLENRTKKDYILQGIDFGYIEKTGTKNYKIKELGEELCSAIIARDEEKKREIWNAGFFHHPYIKKVLHFLEEPRTREEIDKKPLNYTSNYYVINWIKEKTKNLHYYPTTEQYVYIPIEYKKVTLEEFWNLITKHYSELSKTEYVGVRIPVEIWKLREKVTTVKKDITDEYFDKLLTKIYKGKEYAGRLELIGAPHPTVIEDERAKKFPIRIDGRTYVFIRMYK